MPQYIDEFNLLASKELRKERLNVCSSCKYKKMRWGVGWCEDCGCILEGKVFLKKEQCPQSKWLAQ
jgi:hypothetical protein